MDDLPPRRSFWHCTTREILAVIALLAVCFTVLTTVSKQEHWDKHDWFRGLVTGLLFAPIALYFVILQRGGTSKP